MKQIGSPITLTTDFGYQDEYVGVMKGVILSLNKRIPIVDLIHNIPPQDISQAAKIVSDNYKYFPIGTVHVAIVDPGVGSRRRILAIKADEHIFVGPDNGIFTPLLVNHNPLEIYSVENKRLFREYVSNTFHGRDIMAPVAAWLASGLSISQVGERLPLNSCVTIGLKEPVLQSNGIAGEVLSIDTFGNIRTNITKLYLDELSFTEQPFLVTKSYALTISDGSYSDVDDHLPAAIINSSGELEICIKDGNAARMLKIDKGERVFVRGHHHIDCLNIGMVEHGMVPTIDFHTQ
jgi:S-adenosylmethionine hydrolase